MGVVQRVCGPAHAGVGRAVVVAAGCWLGALANAAPAIPIDAQSEQWLELDSGESVTLTAPVTPGYWVFEAEERLLDVVITVRDSSSSAPLVLDGLDRGAAQLTWLVEAVQPMALKIELTAREKDARTGAVRIRLRAIPPAQADQQRLRALATETELSQLTPESGDAQLRAALESTDTLIEDRAALGDSARAARVVLIRAQIALQLGSSHEAAQQAEIAGELYERAGDTYAQGLALNTAGLANTDAGNFDTAARLLNRSRPLLAPVYDGVAVNPADSNLCYINMRTRQWQRAETCYLPLLPLAAESGDVRTLSTLQNNLGGSYAKRGQPVEAVEFLERALNQPTNLAPTKSRARLLNNLATQYRLLGRAQNALNYYQDALRIYRRIDDASQTARTLNNIGVAYASLGVPQQALPFMREALALRTPAQDELTVHAMNTLAACERSLGNFDASRGLLAEAAALSERIDDRAGNLRARVALGIVESQAGNNAMAVTLLSRAITELRDNSAEIRLLSQALHHYGISSGASNRAAALRSLAEALKLRREIGDRFGEAETLTATAWSYWFSDAPDDAMRNAKAALQIIDSLRADIASPDLRASYQAAVSGAFEILIYGLMRKTDGGNDALETAERFRARTLIDVLDKTDSDTIAAVPEALLRERSRIRGEINRRQDERLRGRTAEDITGLTAALDVLDDRIAGIDPRYRAVRRDTSLSNDAMRALLDEKDVALQYFLGREESYVWLITRDSVQAHRLPPAAEINALARQAHRAISTRAGNAAVSATLGELLLGPFVDALQNAQRISIVADGALHYLPFDTLTTGTIATPLMSGAIVTYLPSLTTLSLVRANERGESSRSIAVFADPVFSSRDARVSAQTAVATLASETQPLNRLALSAQEAEAIASLAGTRRVASFIGFDATLSNLRSEAVSAAGIVHIAAHGFVDDEIPARTGLALSMLDEDGGAQTGFVGLRDIYELRLNAELVVLSACETALGANLAGEGLLGLTRGFMYAGASRVVASLWQVEDRATAELMQRFYAAMLTGGMSPAAALAAAKADLRQSRRWRHPYYWSGFVLIGDSGELR